MVIGAANDGESLVAEPEVVADRSDVLTPPDDSPIASASAMAGWVVLMELFRLGPQVLNDGPHNQAYRTSVLVPSRQR